MCAEANLNTASQRLDFGYLMCTLKTFNTYVQGSCLENKVYRLFLALSRLMSLKAKQGCLLY